MIKKFNQFVNEGSLWSGAVRRNTTNAVRKEDETLEHKVRRNPEWVDMGLSVVWANYNVGADENNLIGDEMMRRDVPKEIESLMPTADDYTELIDNVDYESGFFGKTAGLYVISRKNGNVLFFPSEVTNDIGGSGYLWMKDAGDCWTFVSRAYFPENDKFRSYNEENYTPMRILKILLVEQEFPVREVRKKFR